MLIAIPKEIKDHEYRVALTPDAVAAAAKRGHRVLIERGAGAGSGFADEDYIRAGAAVVPRDRLFADAELIVKVKEPLASERSFRPGQILMSYLHLAADRELTEALLKTGVAAIAYETIQLADGSLPALRPMSEIAGRMAVMVGAFYLQKAHGGSGVLLPGVPGVAPARVVILGGGTVGTNAAKMAVGLGAQVTVFHPDTARLRQLEDLFFGRVITRVSQPELIEQAVLSADLVIGAVYVVGARAPRLISRTTVAGMRRGSVIVDVSIDQGGCAETSRPTTHTDPVYVAEGVTHYCVANMPGAYPRTSTRALVNEILPYVLKVADHGLDRACGDDPALALGLNLRDGRIVHPAVAAAFAGK
jgi:alanine dehydrogenase